MSAAAAPDAPPVNLKFQGPQPAPLPPLKEEVQKLVSRAGVWGVIPVPVERIAESLRYVPFLFTPDDDSRSFVGGINPDKREIYLNDELSPVDRRFVLAHELAHAVLHPGIPVVDTMENLHAPRTVPESEANSFAAELLMPEDEFRLVWVSRRANEKRVAAYFGVSIKAAMDHALLLSLPTFYS